MKKEQIFRLLNANKRQETYTHKPIESLLKVILYKYTGRKIIQIVETMIEGLKEPLEIVFKPIKRFTKKDLECTDPNTQEKKSIVNDSYKHRPESTVDEPKNRTHQQTSIKFIDKEKNVSQFNPDEYFF